MSLAARRLAEQAPALWGLSRGLATKAVAAGQGSAVTLRDEDLPTTTMPGQAHVGDLRSTSALSVGDGIKTHTDKWLQGSGKPPIQYIQEAAPIKVHGLVVASYGSDDPGLGCPVEYISLKGTSRERPAVCKYTGNKYYSEDWAGGAH